MTQRQLGEIEVKIATYETERIESIEEASVTVDINDTPVLFHATAYARNVLVAKILVCGENDEIQYATLYGDQIRASKDTCIKILKAIVYKQDQLWEQYFFKVRSLYVDS